jgi:hypothetical protein
MEALLVGMVDSKVLDRAELQRLADRIALAQKTAPPAKNAAASKTHSASKIWRSHDRNPGSPHA